MKRLIFLFCVIMIYAAASAQNIVQAEYFVNDDPGFGNGTAISVAPGINEELSFNVSTDGLQSGLHILFIRIKDENGAWSTAVNRPFMIGNYPLDPLMSIVQAEYFIDEDPGHGMGTPVLFEPNNGIAEKNFLADLSGVEAGNHMLYVRTLDENGRWSITYAKSFEVELPLIVAAFSADITEGSLPLMVQFIDETYISEPHTWLWDFGDGNTCTLQHPQNTYALPGKYTVSLTATSLDGTDIETKIDYITVYPPLYSLEYFFNDDPGYGNGTFVGNYSSINGGFEFTASLDELDFGFHQLFFRVQDTAGYWSHTYSRPFVKAALPSDDMPDVVQVEYFVDNDPGYGLGYPLAFDPGATAIVEVLIPLENLNTGLHRLFVRAKDERGNWSIVFNQEFEVDFSTDCPAPFALNVTEISTNSATIGWSPGGAETVWNVFYGLAGFIPGSEGILIEDVPDSSWLLEGLMPDTGYDFYVRAVCAEGYTSEWAGPVSFTTLEEQIVTLPILTTASVGQITQYSATSGGTVIDDGGAAVVARGVVWSESETPTLENNNGITSDGQGTGSFISQLSGLTPATQYYVRAYATNNIGTGYGEQLMFTTLLELTIPVLTTAIVTAITQITAISGGEVTFDGNTPVTARGVVWSTGQNPTVETNEGVTSDGQGTGSFISQISGLTSATQYYVRAYATNNIGTGYGEQLMFTTLLGLTIPEVTTTIVTAITQTSAISGGEVIFDGNKPVTARGVVWSTGQNPTIETNEGITSDGQGTGSFISQLIDLTPATQYYVRAYATNSIGTGYGEQLMFTTLLELTIPLVTTAPVTYITQNSAISGGETTFDGNASITARGVVWSASQNPTIESNEGFTTDGQGLGSFFSQLSGLAPETQYHVRAYATNSVGTGYGEEMTFTTLSALLAGVNLIRGGPPETNPVAIPIQIAGVDAYPYQGNLNAWYGNWQAPQAIFDQGEFVNNPDLWSNIQGSSGAGTTWINQNPGNGYGILVVDLQQVRNINNISVFQMFSDGQTTHIALAGHPETGTSAPDAFDPGWLEFLAKSPVGAGSNYQTYIGDPSKFEANASTRYVKIMAYNDGSFGFGTYIELKGIKMYGSELQLLPEVATAEVTDITHNGAISGGNVIDAGSTAVTERGVVWSTSDLPTIGNSEGFTVDGSGLGVYTSNLSALASGTNYYVRAYATNAAGTAYGNQITFTTLSLHAISISQGWNGLSSYIMPAEPAMESVFSPISDELIIAQTMTGMYYPGQNINNIGNWVSHSAYKVKTNAACMLEITGETETNLAVQLNAGWSLLPVVTSDGADPADLFMPVNGFVIAKDVAGAGVFWPQYNINSIGYILPGKAYYVLMTAPVVVDYTGMKSSINLTGFKNLSGLEGFEITPTPSTHTIAILPEALKDFEPGTIIGAYDQAESCFGAVVYDSEFVSLTVFGDDPTTAEKDGFFEGEMIVFKNLTGFDPARAGLSGLNPTFDPQLPSADCLFTENGLSVITGFESATGDGSADFGRLVNIFPNPSDGVVNITGLQSGAKITVTDVQGQIVRAAETATAVQTTVDLTGHNAGVYFIKIEQNGQNIFRKIVLR